MHEVPLELFPRPSVDTSRFSILAILHRTIIDANYQRLYDCFFVCLKYRQALTQAIPTPLTVAAPGLP